MVVVGCLQTSPREANQPPHDPLITRLNQGIGNLDDNLARVRRHIAEMTQMPASDDVIIQELHALDLAGWRLHEQQWQLQLKHLTFALDRIRQAETAHTPKERLRDEWLAQQQTFTSSLQELREKRYELERKRLLLESRLVQRYFD
jgi:hypothetical protein